MSTLKEKLAIVFISKNISKQFKELFIKKSFRMSMAALVFSLVDQVGLLQLLKILSYATLWILQILSK